MSADDRRTFISSQGAHCDSLKINGKCPNGAEAPVWTIGVGSSQTPSQTDRKSVSSSRTPSQGLSASTSSEVSEDDVNGCAGAGLDSSDDSLVFTIISFDTACVLLALGIVWVFIRKRGGEQHYTQGRTVSGTNELELDSVRREMPATIAWEE
jgi:hypothetical protein